VGKEGGVVALLGSKSIPQRPARKKDEEKEKDEEEEKDEEDKEGGGGGGGGGEGEETTGSQGKSISIHIYSTTFRRKTNPEVHAR